MGPIGSKVIKVKGQIYVGFFCLFLPGPWADLHQTWRAAPDISLRGSFFERSRSSRSKVKFVIFSLFLSVCLI